MAVGPIKLVKKDANHNLEIISISCTVNQLNFAARKIHRLLIIANLGIFRAIKFRVLVFQDPFLTKTFLHKNACNFLNYGPIFKI